MQKLTWTVEVGISKTWIQDGFELKEDHLKEAILSEVLPFAFPSEVIVKIIGKPTQKQLETVLAED